MHSSFPVFFHETIRAVALFVRSQGICQGVAVRKMAMSLAFVGMEVATKKKVQDDRRGYFLHRGYFLSLLLCPKLENSVSERNCLRGNTVLDFYNQSTY
jgi:hypothetical protein